MQVDYFVIDRRLIVSTTARRFYQVSAWISLALFAGILTGWFGPGGPHWIEPIARPLLMIGVLGAAITIVGMEMFLFRFDESGALKQIFWFVVMLLPLLGAALYCLLVYSRSPAVKALSSPRSASV